MAKKMGIVTTLKPMIIGLRGNVTGNKTEQFLANDLERKNIKNMFRELLGWDIHMQIIEIGQGRKDKYFCRVVEEKNNLFFEDGNGKRSIADIFNKHIGKEIDIKITIHLPLIIISKYSEDSCGSCCE